VPLRGFFINLRDSGEPLGSLSLFLKKPRYAASLTSLFFSVGDHKSCPAARRRPLHRPPSATSPPSHRLGERFLPPPPTLPGGPSVTPWCSVRIPHRGGATSEPLHTDRGDCVHHARRGHDRAKALGRFGRWARLSLKALGRILSPVLFLNFPFSKNIYSFK
jgi:hypothetical protein